ncbi:hypothetical protein MLD38_022116 [Melastoma candidum]|uniref:Uncharacterized protein n=1 Tax=Melastoma candidum TaxID=119954 RepID=A0ACB9QIB3_9MYRT|nr:hypothetical protein MLD38_022116 [Melastoma candidum]
MIVEISERAKQPIIYSYTCFINGFAAVMDETEAAEIASTAPCFAALSCPMLSSSSQLPLSDDQNRYDALCTENPTVMAVFPKRTRKLHTMRTWDFLGLGKGGAAMPGSTRERAMFGEDMIIANLDTGIKDNITCNRFSPSFVLYFESFKEPQHAHANIISSHDYCYRKLIGVRYFNDGYVAEGETVTATPNDVDGHGTRALSTAGGALIPNANCFCFANGTMKGGSPCALIANGVDVISFSAGGSPNEFFDDVIAASLFHAILKGIPVVASGGNEGPRAGTVTNLAPWTFTVAASTLDRGENDVFHDNHVIPASYINSADGQILFAYYNSSLSPMAFMTKAATVLGTKPAPVMADFSSRGPSTMEPTILKEWTYYRHYLKPLIQPLNGQNQLLPLVSCRVPRCPALMSQVLSAFSEQCTQNGDPAAVRSAIMTTAVTLDNNRQMINDFNYERATAFQFGVGHVRPV